MTCGWICYSKMQTTIKASYRHIITLFSSTSSQRSKKTKLTPQPLDKMDVFSKVKKNPKNKEQNHLETKLQGIKLNLVHSLLSQSPEKRLSPFSSAVSDTIWRGDESPQNSQLLTPQIFQTEAAQIKPIPSCQMTNNNRKMTKLQKITGWTGRKGEK